jgi:hypothetical protein
VTLSATRDQNNRLALHWPGKVKIDLTGKYFPQRDRHRVGPDCRARQRALRVTRI